MICPRCESRNISMGADGKAYCPDCMATILDAELTINLDRIIEKLDEFVEDVKPDDRYLALEAIQSWLDKKAEVF